MALTVFGKTVLTTIEEWCDPRHTAIVVVDVQNDFCHPDGSLGRRGADMTPLQTMIADLSRLLDGARRAGVPVIYMSYTVEPNGMSESPAWLSYRLKLHGEYVPICIRGTWGAEICEGVAPWPNDTLLTKRRQPSWLATDLDQILRANAIQTLITTGTMTGACVDWTARLAIQMDYYSVVPADCVSQADCTAHETALDRLRAALPEGAVTTTDELLNVWAAVPAR